MKNPKICVLALCFLAAAYSGAGNTLDFFTIESVKFGSDKRLEVTVQTKERTRASTLYLKTYYYDPARKLIETNSMERGGSGAGPSSPMPVFFTKSKVEKLFFVVPKKVLETRGWQAVVVFGDKQAAVAAVYPKNLVTMFDFPERQQVDKPVRTERQAVIDPVVEHVVKTFNDKQPQITLFMRPPVGMTDISEANGVLAMCLLANNVGEIKRRLQELEAKDDVGAVLRFAEKHKLVILCWGSRSLWDPRASWDEQSKQINKHMDETFDDVAKAWAKGVEELSQKYGMPDKGFLLWGISGSAQYAARLALRQPQYFLAIHVHVPSSFDKPTPEANRVLWCLTTGENESGYERSLRFYSASRELGYPIVYKAIVGLGHAGHPLAEQLGLDFYEYALTVRDEQTKFDAEMNNPFSNVRKELIKQPDRPWPESFRNPAFVGDIVNQEIFRFDRIEMVPEAFRTMLPTRELADTWSRVE